MSATEVVVDGTLRSDGSLELHQKPNLRPGRVTVILKQAAELPGQEDWWQLMQRARQELEAAGSSFMTAEEVQSHVEWLREGDRIDELLRAADEQSRRQE